MRLKRTVEQIKKDMESGTKVCNDCGKRQEFKYFCKDVSQVDNLKRKCKVCSSKSTKKWREKHPDLQKLSRGYALKANYGITQEEYDKMLEGQGGKCAICGSEDPKGRRKSKHFAVDHDHETGAVRSLLCGNCNTAIGLLQDSSEVAKLAVRYLEINGK